MHEKTEIDTAMESFISEAQKEFAEPLIEEAPVTPVEPTQEATGEQENTATPVPPQDPTERGIERLVSREMELREREARLTSAEKEMETLRSRLRELEPRAVTEDLLNQIKLSPSQGLRALGLDPDEVVRAALVEKLGDKANDPELKEMMEKTRMRREFESLKAQVQMAERQRAAQEYYSKVASGANEYVRNHDGLSKHAPTVATVAKSNPDHVFQEIMEEITRDANVRAAREPNGDVISYEEAASRVEKRWAAMKNLLSPVIQASTPAPKTSVEAKTPAVSPPSTIKPPERPLAPWLQRKTTEEEAIRLAISEWQRAEGQKP